MGAHAYWYSVTYESDYNAALDKLREREFNAGRYNPVIPFPLFPVTDLSESPGPQHSSIFLPLEETQGEGTRSILDVLSISRKDEYFSARLLSNEETKKYFGNSMPTQEMVEQNHTFFDEIERGKAFCIVIYKSGKPDRLFFAGFSFD